MAHRFNPKHIHKLDNPERLKLLPPSEILAPLAISGQDNVADIGCGPGFFTIPAAKLTSGTVYAVDIEPQMLDALKEKAASADAANIRLVVSDAQHIELPDNAADKVFCALVLHEVGDLRQTLTELKRIIQPNGKLLILEWEKKTTESGPPVEERLDKSELQKLLQEVGFVTQISQPTPSHYLLLGSKQSHAN